MSQVANINNVRVFSDKTVSAIVNTRVVFADGSWCDTHTRQVVNKGPGYINFDTPAEESDDQTVTIGPKTFRATNLDVDGVTASLEVQTHNNPTIEVIIKGPKSLAEGIAVTQDEDTVSISGGENDSTSGITMISGGGRPSIRVGRITGGSIVAGRSIVVGDVVIGGRGGSTIITGEDMPTVTVKVPQGTALDISGVEGDISIGNTKGPLRLSLSSSNDVNIGAVAKLTAKMSGSGVINIASAEGDVKLRMSGSGSINVRGGKIGELEADLSGSGDIRVFAPAQDADLGLSGSGDIYVAQVTNKPRKHKSGMGDIRIGNW